MIIALLFIIQSAKSSDSQLKVKLECLADYLKSRNVTDEQFESVTDKQSDRLTCNNNVKTKINDFHNEVQYQMETNNLQKPYADCAINKVIASESYELAKLHALFVDEKGIGLKFWKYNSKKSKVDALEAQAREVVDDAIIDCKGHFDYGNFFDDYYKKHETELAESDKIDYCIRDHLVKKNFIEPIKYRGFRVNPKNIDTSGLICAGELQTIMSKMKEDTAKATNNCITDVFYNNGYLELILKIQVLATLGLDKQQKDKERKQFIDSMIELTKKIKICSLSVNAA